LSRLLAFDVDSTLIELESLDYAVARAFETRQLGEAGDAQEVERLTAAGMSGNLDFSASLQARIDIGRLSRSEIETAAAEIAQRPTPGIEDLLDERRRSGDRIVAISGGFHALIDPALAALGFSPGELHANRFVFDGEIATGFDPAQPVSRNGGKAETLRAIRGEATEVIMIGDGVTDMEAWRDGAADRFIGFGAIARREKVEREAPAYALSVDALARLLD
jgi:HAD superfamily phosphoserine phosphatase-like hydrolase